MGKQKYTAIECGTDKALKDFVSEADYFSKGTYTGRLTGKPGDVTLTYASYEPWSLRGDGAKNPLIIWLHGGGEGGKDVSITLLGNEVVNPALLSSRDGYLLELTGWTQGSQAS